MSANMGIASISSLHLMHGIGLLWLAVVVVCHWLTPIQQPANFDELYLPTTFTDAVPVNCTRCVLQSNFAEINKSTWGRCRRLKLLVSTMLMPGVHLTSPGKCYRLFEKPTQKKRQWNSRFAFWLLCSVSKKRQALQHPVWQKLLRLPGRYTCVYCTRADHKHRGWRGRISTLWSCFIISPWYDKRHIAWT